MSALPSASSVIAAPDDTISNFSSAELTSAATRGGWPARASTASQKSRCEPAEAGSAATGSLAISGDLMILGACQRGAGADRDEPPFGGEYFGLDLGGVNGQPHERGVGRAVP